MDDLNLSQYQQVLFQTENENISKANVQRKNLVQMVKASYRSSNSFSCDLLETRLREYTNTVEHEDVYINSLKQIFKGKNKEFPITFKSNLDKIKINSIVKPLSCSNKNHCLSVNFHDAEFNEFYNNISIKKSVTENQGYGSNRAATMKTTNNNNPRKFNMEPKKNFSCNFKTAKDELYIQNMKKPVNSSEQSNRSHTMGQKRKLGTRRNINSKFISPLLSNNESQEEIKSDEWPDEIDERLKIFEPKIVELIKSEIMDCGANIHWDDIAGLSFAKAAIQEAVVWPMLRPDIFTGLRRPPKGILLFGPPGTGKTLIGKCVASQSKSTFFSISASSLTSKWIGDGEKMVRALFVVARVHQPSVIFIDEIDSLLSQRSDTEHESSRRIKTEFLVQLDGATTDSEERILVIGATNRPQELDEAARRRFVKRLYIPLPELEARLQLVQKLISKENHQLQMEDFDTIAKLSSGYSGADIRNLCSEASLGPIRSIDINRIEHIQAAEVRPLAMEDFEKAFIRVRSSVSPQDLEQYVIWDKTYGSGSVF